MSHATGGRGARTRTDSVGAFATKNPGQVFDGVGVHQDCPRVNAPKVSKEREIHSREAMRWRCLHDSPFKLRGVDNTQKKKKILSVWQQRWLEWRSPQRPWIPDTKVSREFRRDAFEASSLTVVGWSLYTCGPVCLPAPRCAQQRRRGGISKRAPLYGNGRLFSVHRGAFHNVCVMIMTCKVCLNANHSVTHTGNYTPNEDLVNPVSINYSFNNKTEWLHFVIYIYFYWNKCHVKVHQSCTLMICFNIDFLGKQLYTTFI